MTKEVKKQEQKKGKREVSWAELTKSKNRVLDKEGNEYELTRDTISKALSKDGLTMSAKWNIRTLGYHVKKDGKLVKTKDEKNSNFSDVTGVKWSKIEPVLREQNEGMVVTLSAGSRKNHFVFILPKDKVTVINHATGKEEEINKENWFEWHQIFSNHGRAYRVSQFFAYQFNLEYNALPRTRYDYSNRSNLNFEEKEDGSWVILLPKYGENKLPDGYHPLDVLQNIANGGNLVDELLGKAVK